MAYMESVKELPHSHIQEILTHAEEYMKHPRYNHPLEDEISGLDGSPPPVNKRARLRICNSIYFPYFFQPLMFIQQELLCAPANCLVLADTHQLAMRHHDFIISDHF